MSTRFAAAHMRADEEAAASPLRRRAVPPPSAAPAFFSCPTPLRITVCLCLAAAAAFVLLSPRGGRDGPGRLRVADVRSLLRPAEPEWKNPTVPTPHSAHKHVDKSRLGVGAGPVGGKDVDGGQSGGRKGAGAGGRKGAGAGGRAEAREREAFGLADTWVDFTRADGVDVEAMSSVGETVERVYGPGTKVGDLPYKIRTWKEIDESSLVLLVVSDHAYQWWQLRIFLYHFERVNQPGKLAILMSSPNHDTFKVPHSCDEPYAGCDGLFLTGDYTVAPDGDSFVVYNRAHGIREYIEHLDATGESAKYSNVFIVEPDMVLLKPLLMEAQPRAPLGFHYFYMEESYFWGNNTQLLKICTTKPALATAIGVPYIIAMDDLKTMLPLWIEKTRVMRLDQPWIEDHPKSWIADMWGFSCVASDLGWDKTYDDPQLAPEPPIDQNVFHRSAVIHYTYGNDVVDNGKILWRWDKRLWYGGPPKPRPMWPLPPQASPLQRLYRHHISAALVEIFGESGPDARIEKRNRDSGVAEQPVA